MDELVMYMYNICIHVYILLFCMGKMGRAGLVGAWGLLEHCVFLFQLIMILQKLNTICSKVLTIRMFDTISFPILLHQHCRNESTLFDFSPSE